MRELIAAMLKEIGFVWIRQSGDGLEALLTIGEGGLPDIIICDIHMQPINGMEFAVRLFAQHRLRIPILFLTGDARPEVVKLSEKINVAGFLLKPPNIDILRSRILSAISENR